MLFLQNFHMESPLQFCFVHILDYQFEIGPLFKEKNGVGFPLANKFHACIHIPTMFKLLNEIPDVKVTIHIKALAIQTFSIPNQDKTFKPKVSPSNTFRSNNCLDEK